jgi:putative DNA primase/helicase
MGLDKESILKATDIPGLVHELLPEMKPVGTDQALVCCKYHDEKNPSLSINTATGLHNCRGCGKTGTVFDLVMVSKGLDFAAACQFMADRAGLKNETEKINFKVTGKFSYHHADGTLAYWKERIEPGFNGRSKDFLFFHGNDIKPGQGFYLPKEKKPAYKGRGDCKPLPYRLPGLLAAAPDALVFVPEGEKKCDFLVSTWGLVATCLDSGAQTKPYQSFIDALAGRHVVILPDNDEAGEKYAATVAAALYGVAASVKVLRLPGLETKEDILDWAGAKL